MFLFLCKGLEYWKKWQVRTVGQSISWEPNLIILIFVISYWLLIWMKAFGGEPKWQVLRGRQNSALPAQSWPCPGRKALWGFVSVHQRLSRSSKPNSPPGPAPGSLCVQSASSSNSVSVGFKRIFCLHIYTPSPFLKDGFKPRCLQERGKNEYIHRRIKKNQFGEKCNNFWWDGWRTKCEFCRLL